MQWWSVIEGKCESEGAIAFPTYGVQVTMEDGGVWSWADVDVDRRVVELLVGRLQAIQPERCHFEDLVLDFIEEMAAKV
ncbi:MAG: hypothetical protein IKA50_03315 [Clostridia bacterium]|nr:hypothetical protein [Clostridia bacterium]